MRNSVTVTADRFAVALTDMLDEIDFDCQEAIRQPVKECLADGRRKVKAESPIRSGEYKSGWGYTMKGKGKNVYGEIGNKKKPGLVHLLEKGHAKVGGGRVAARPHVAPVAEEVFDELEAKVSDAIGAAL